MSDIITNRSVQAELVAMEARAVEAEQEVSNLEVRYESLLREYDEAEQERDALREALERIAGLDADVDLWDHDPPESIPVDAMVNAGDVLTRAQSIARAAVSGSGKADQG